MLENKQKNWQLFINFTNGRKSKNNIFTFENTSNIYKGICDIKNNILDINLNNKAGILFLNSNNNNFYFKNILLNTKYFSKYDTIDLINKDFQIFDHHVIIKKIFFEYNVRNINDFLLVISSLLQNNKNLIYFNNNTLTYSKNLDNNYYYEYSAIDDIEVRSILNVEQNEILNKSLAEIGFDILNN